MAQGEPEAMWAASFTDLLGLDGYEVD